MYPVLFAINGWPVTSFGLFAILGISLATFITWRLAIAYDFNKEQILDLIFWTSIISFLSSKIYYVLTHGFGFMAIIKNPLQLIFSNQQFGLSFWGGLFGGALAIYLLARLWRIMFWQIADIAIVGLFLLISVGSIGCLFGSCQYGLPSEAIYSVTQVGLIDRRFPLQIIESIVFFGLFLHTWRLSLKFHFTGKIFAVGLVYLGILKLAIEPWRGDRQFLYQNISTGTIYSIFIIAIGTYVYYLRSKKSFISDLKSLYLSIFSSKKRKESILQLKKRWYNLRVGLKLKIQRKPKHFFKKINVKTTPPKI